MRRAGEIVEHDPGKEPPGAEMGGGFGGLPPGLGRRERAPRPGTRASSTLPGMKRRERELALELIKRHPGWSDRRIARVLSERYGFSVSHVSVGRWRRAAGYPTFVRWIGSSGVRRRARSL